MLKTKRKTVETISFRVDVIKRDIEEGKCGLVAHCMHKVAIERALRQRDPKGGDHKVKVDGGNIKFNLNGWRYRGLTPRIVKRTLIRFDHERKLRAQAEKAGKPFVSKIVPVNYRFESEKTTKIQPFTRERKDQVNARRNERRAAGKPDKKTYDLRYRVEGLGGV